MSRRGERLRLGAWLSSKARLLADLWVWVRISRLAVAPLLRTQAVGAGEAFEKVREVGIGVVARDAGLAEPPDSAVEVVDAQAAVHSRIRARLRGCCVCASSALQLYVIRAA